MDAQCFGLEMEDGKVVKVYVKNNDAEGFEEAMSKRLGEDDDIQTALDELGKEFEIVQVIWPDEDNDLKQTDDSNSEEEEEENEDAEDDGSESMNKNVKWDDEKNESLTIGQRFAKRLTELKWTDEEAGEYAAAKAKDPADDEPAEETPEPDDSKPKAPQGADAKWKIEKDEKGMTISNDRFSIELDDDETLDLLNKIADKKIARFKNEQGKVIYVFSPRGSDYILKTPEYQGGFRIPADVVNKMMD
jgi:hypothetical protein